MNRTAHFEYALHKYLIIKQILWLAVFVYPCQLQLQDLNFSIGERVLLKVNCLINNFAIQAHCLGTAVSVRHMRLCVNTCRDRLCYLGCVSPLGMEDGRIEDSQITASSVIRGRTPYAWLARLNRNIPSWGAWCPDYTGGKKTEKNYDQYIQIDLLNLTKVTGIATQGRSYSRGREYAKDYKISYRRDGGIWNFYHGKDQTVKVNFISTLNWYVHI